MAFLFDSQSPDTDIYYRFKSLRGTRWNCGNGYDDGPTDSWRVIGSKTLSQRDQLRALYASLAYDRCHHDYDCCGCPGSHVSIRKLKPGVFWVHCKTTFNY